MTAILDRPPKLPPIRNRVKIEQAIARLGTAHAAARALGIEYVIAARVLNGMREGAR